MMQAMSWFRANKFKTFLLTAVYLALVIFPHEWVGLRINNLFSGMTKDQYNLTILIFFLALLFFIGFFLFKNLKEHPQKKSLTSWLIFTVLSMFLVAKYLFVVNIEGVHFVQYAIAAILLFGLIENYFVVLFIAFCIGVFDESYQYFYLSPDLINYFDFNDIITNLFGGAFGLLVLKTYKVSESNTQKGIYRKGFLFPLMGFALMFVVLLQTSFLSIYPSNDRYMLIKELNEKESFETGFGLWIDGGADCVRSSSEPQYANTGDWYIRLRDNSASSFITSSSMHLAKYDSLKVSLSYTTQGMASGDAFYLEISNDNGHTWTSKKTWMYKSHFRNKLRGGDAITLLAPFSNKSKLRIRCDADDKTNRIYLDDVFIRGFPSKVGFHIVQPLEGLLILTSLFVLYFFYFRTKLVETN